MTKEQKLVSSLLETFSSRRLSPGTRIQDERTQAANFGVSRITIRRAMDRLEEYGVVERRQGCGTFLRCEPTEMIIRSIRESFSNQKGISPLPGSIINAAGKRPLRLVFFHNWKPTHFIFKEVIGGILDYMGSQRHLLTIHLLREEPESVTYSEFSSQVFSCDADGIILFDTFYSRDRQNFNRLKVPYVLIDLSRSMNNSIGLDMISACRQAVEQLVANGHRQIAVLQKTYEESYESFEPLCAALKKEYEIDQLLYLGGTHPLADLPMGADGPTGIFVTDDFYCCEVCKKLVNSGRAIGTDVEVISEANNNFNPGLPEHVGRMIFDSGKVGHLAAQMLEQIILNHETSFPPIRLGAKYISGTRNL
jgi:DNA-binding LacI/PurR family transcriptional regulator